MTSAAAQLMQAAWIAGPAVAAVGLLYLVAWFRRGPVPARHRRR